MIGDLTRKRGSGRAARRERNVRPRRKVPKRAGCIPPSERRRSPRRRRREGEQERRKRTGLRTPILGILFAVGVKSWIVTGPWTVTRRLKGHSSRIESVAFSPDGGRIVTASNDGTARVWDAESATCLLVIEGHERCINDASYSPDGKRIVTASDDESARVWDAESGECLLVLKGRARWVWSARFSPDGGRLLTDDRLSRRLWDAETGALIAELAVDVRRACCAFSPDGRRVITASADHTTRVWDAETGEGLAVLKTDPGNVAGRDYCGSLSPRYACAAFSPDGALTVTASAGTARLRDARTGELLHVLGRHELPVSCAVFSPDGRHILTADISHVARMWDAATGRLFFSAYEKELVDWDDSPGSLEATFSPDGTRFVTMSKERTSHVWDAQTGEGLARLGGLAVHRAVFSPDGTRIATAGEGSWVRIWRRRRPERLYGLLWLPEVWLTIAVGVALAASLASDLRA